MGPKGGLSVGRPGRLCTVSRVLGTAAGACALLVLSSAPARAVRATGPPGYSAKEAAAGAGHSCVVGGGRPDVAWSTMRNPILSEPDMGVKDQAVVWYRGRWHMLFSEVTDDRSAPGGVRWDIGVATSPDLDHWSAPASWPSQAGVLGVASPDVVREPSGRFVVPYESDPGQSDGAQDRLYYRTSSDLVHWSKPQPLAQNLAPSHHDRMIDPALAWTGHYLLLAYKSGVAGASQRMEMAWSPSGSLRGPWRRIGPTDIDVVDGTVENYELMVIGGRWRLVATSNNLDQPWIFTLAGSPGHLSSWLHWTAGRELQVPSESWNSGSGITGVEYEHANSAFVCMDGATALLFYAGSNELTQFGGWGHAEIGVARSTDLVHWSVPPG
jgi:hypothetical protein